MLKIKLNQQKILRLLLEGETIRSSDIHAALIKAGEEVSLVTIKRTLSAMVKSRIISIVGSGRATAYQVTVPGRIFADINAKEYFSAEPDKRHGMSRYNFDLFGLLPTDIFTSHELKVLHDATVEYNKRIKDLPASIQKKELERLIIELSWKSSKIEGNTYTLLDTEKLILENKEAPGHDKKEAKMILDHKDAFNFIHKNTRQFKTLTRSNLEEVHRILVNGLDVGFGLRSKPVGVLGSKYRPLDNVHQIREAVDALSQAVEKMSTPYAKALIALLGISYIQPFEDGNKRTSRLMANAILLAHHCAPLSYRSVDENEYREATLIFYELNAIGPFKKIFVDQYDFAARNYVVS
jgi:fido (protein-threonine AMPylation protein)